MNTIPQVLAYVRMDRQALVSWTRDDRQIFATVTEADEFLADFAAANGWQLVEFDRTGYHALARVAVGVEGIRPYAKWGTQVYPVEMRRIETTAGPYPDGRYGILPAIGTPIPVRARVRADRTSVQYR